MFVCAPCACSDPGGQKMESDPLEPELQMVVSCHVGAGNRTQVLRKNKCSKPLSFSSRPRGQHFKQHWDQVLLCEWEVSLPYGSSDVSPSFCS